MAHIRSQLQKNFHEQPQYMSDSTNKLSDAIAESFDKIEDSTNINNSSEESEQPVKKTETPEVNNDQSESEESFAEKAELKGRTPEELEEIYQNWNRSYTQKRQKEREELKALQAKVAEYEKMSANRTPSQAMQQSDIESPDLKTQQAIAKKQYSLGNMSIDDYTAYVAQLAAEEARRATVETLQAREDEQYQQSALREFNNLDQRFDDRFINPDSPEFNETNAWMYSQVATQMAEALDDYIKENGTSVGFNTKEMAKEFISRFDTYVDSLVKNRVVESNRVAQEKQKHFSRVTPKGTGASSVSGGKRDLRSLLNESF